MHIRPATEKDRQSWDAYVWDHPGAVAYHQFAWGQAVKKAYGFEPVYLLADIDGKITGVLPLVRLKIPFLGSHLVSLPYCDLGGALVDDEPTRAALTDFAVAMAIAQGDKQLELRESSTAQAETATNKVRMVLPLPKSADALMAGFKAKLRSQVKKPLKDGLTAELGGEELLNNFYDVLAINMRDLGSPVHSRKWFAEIVEQYKDNARVGLVRSPEGRAIAAGIILLHKGAVSIPWASTLRQYNRVNPNMLLYWTFLAYAADNGYAVFDFGRSTPEEGTYKFKQQWGAEPVSLCWRDLLKSDRQHDQTQSVSTLRTVVEKLWVRFPLPVATGLGSRIRPYISL